MLYVEETFQPSAKWFLREARRLAAANASLYTVRCGGIDPVLTQAAVL
jgi:hypothetical protein